MKPVNKTVYVLLALFLGGLGAHQFYAGHTAKGVMYALFCWTFIPAFLALCSCIKAAFEQADGNGNILR